MTCVIRYLCANVRRHKFKHWIIFLVFLVLYCDLSGLFLRVHELSYATDFSYPVTRDVRPLAQQLKVGQVPDVPPVHDGHGRQLYKNPRALCRADDDSHYLQLGLVFVVRSAVANFARRQAVRETWGAKKQFSGRMTRTVFLLGSHPEVEMQRPVEEEFLQFGDVVQGAFLEDDDNARTLTTLLGLRWSAEHCPTARAYMFVDDDQFVSTANLAAFLAKPSSCRRHDKEEIYRFFNPRDAHKNIMLSSRQLRELPAVDDDLPDDFRLYAGHVVPSARPHRERWSKWFVDIDEYPFDRWPPYVDSGAYVLSRTALVDLYYASYFTQIFRFDDIYLGIVARKVGLDPLHCEEFHVSQPAYHSVHSYKYVIASKGYEDPDLLRKVWKELNKNP